MRIFTPPGVFQPRSDSWMLVDAGRQAALQPRTNAPWISIVLVIGAQYARARASGVRDVRSREPGRVPLLHGVRRPAGRARAGA